VVAAHTRTKPNFRLKPFHIEGTDTLLSASVQHPFLRSRQSNLFGTAGFDIRNTNSDSFGSPLYADRLKVGRLGASYDFVDGLLAVNRVDVQLSKGFGWDDDSGSGLRSRFNGRTNFWKGTVQANRLQQISGPFGLYVSGTGQVASGALLSAEQFGLGGPTFLSAYDPSEVTGDSGIGGRAELQYSQSSNYKYLATYQLYTFYDVGEVWTRNPAAGLKHAVSLASAGAGVRFNIMAPLSGSLEVAKPLTKQVNAYAPNHGNDPRVFMSLAYRY
jgi:hemolysin activation/secretion protein